ncbi:hypothetical protein FF1_003855 [Malus domestica]|uniref:uncharacterized protein isoform X1 n=1 Tax=Malus domestica TaxID=3750 RepID=UPI0004990E73|nr:uncharacterized protein LOC103445397 [Malus domestica]XP_050105196.1 uncharacterized protein LOC126584867 isoform X1 [Malus sylvestris]
MAPRNRWLQIPEGWELDKREGNHVKGFFCPRTGQSFLTFEHLMRYMRWVDYYADSNAKKPYAKKPNNGAIFKFGENPSSGQNPKPLMIEQGYTAASTQKPDPNFQFVAKPSTSKAKHKQQRRK